MSSHAIFRADNRLGREIRPITFTLDTTPAADGSCMCEMGLTVVQVSVYGPREPRRAGAAGAGGSGGQQQHGGGGGGGAGGEAATVEVDVGVAGFVAGERRKRNRGDRRTVETATAIKNTFEPIISTNLYPRSQIDIFVQVLSQDGGMLAAAINATTLALIHAGISLTDPLSSLAVSALHDAPLLDPSGTEESDLPTVTVACLAPSAQATAEGQLFKADPEAGDEDLYEGRVTLVNMETRLSIDRFEEMLKLAVQACRVISREMDNVMRAYTKELADKLKTGAGGALARQQELQQSLQARPPPIEAGSTGRIDDEDMDED